MRWTVYALFVLAIFAATPGAAQDATHIHVRSLEPAINQLIARGLERSATFGALVAAIDASDSYVYIRSGDCRGGVRSCFVAVTGAESTRFLWVEINTRKTDASVVSWIGHELRHALEVIEQPAVRNNVDIFFFYQRIGTHSLSNTLETRAAVEAGTKIRQEVIAYERHRTR